MTASGTALAALNFRDLGGITVDGGRLRNGLLFRCEGPANVDASAVAALAALGIRLVIDLRSTGEYRGQAGNAGWGLRVTSCDVANDFRAQDGADWHGLGEALGGEQVRSRMLDTYRAMPGALAKHLAPLIATMAAGEMPVLIHCTAGKDRTGVLVALLLRLLGANPEAITHDYLLSCSFGAAPHNRVRVQRQLGKILNATIDEAALDAVIGVDPAYLAAAIETIDERWGSFEAYLAHANVSAEQIARLRELMVEA